MFKTLFQSIVSFLVFWINSRVNVGVLIITIQGQTVEIPIKTLENWSFFQFCPYFVTRSSLHFGSLKLKTVDSGSIWNWVVFDYIFTKMQKSTWWLNGCHGYHAKEISLILPFCRPRKIALTPHEVWSCQSKGFISYGRGSIEPPPIRQRNVEQIA